MSYVPFSQKQRRAMTWWMPKSADCRFEAIVCDGAVRSGKTMAMGLGFFLWAQTSFTGRRFALCGKTIGALRRNVLSELLPRLKELGAEIQERIWTPLVMWRMGISAMERWGHRCFHMERATSP